MDIRSIFKPPEPKADHPLFRYGMLVFILVLLAEKIKWHLSLTPGYTGDPYGGYVVILMLLLLLLMFGLMMF